MASVTVEGLTKVYPNGFTGVADLDLAIGDGEFLVLVGPSGCGKSTALRMVAGLEEITAGVLRIGGEVVNDLEPKERDVAMVFQNYALYPHMTVAQNIGFALKLAGRPRAEIRERVLVAARRLQLEPWLDRKPGQLSGGQRQRVAMGRAIVRDPAVFLMDEPLSNLDAKLRVQMRAEIAGLQRQLGTTTIYVTHDQIEAMTMGDRVAVLRDGRLQQVAPPEALYDEPDNVFVATFIGSPAMNLLEGTVSLDGSPGSLDGSPGSLDGSPGSLDGSPGSLTLGSQRLTLTPSVLARRPALAGYDGRAVIVGIRPEATADAALGGPAERGTTLKATVELREALGAELVLHVRTDATQARSDDALPSTADLEPVEGVVGDPALDKGEGAAMVVRFDPHSRARAGDLIEMAVDVERLHLFDPETGRSIRA
jgi:multiple sugar transport system ATP-binding protein